ncbi:MAG: ABC transporter substrate-binding protein [Rhodopila sp.]|nr:ABC transporter substrate-binding protein [Rhodopila sp.]
MKRSVLAAVCCAMVSVAAQAETPLRIGILDDMGGIYSESSGPGVVTAAQMAVEDFGSNVLGRPIEMVSADHQNRADTALAIARRWYDVEGVQMIAGLSNSAVALAVQQISQEKGRIDIVSGAATMELTGKQCAPFGFHWTYDTWALAHGTVGPVVEAGGRKWFFLTADYAFGKALEGAAAEQVRKAGGQVLGRVRHPISTSDYSSFLLTAQSSGADVIGIANAGDDAINAIKQAAEFGLTRDGHNLAGLLITITNIHGLGLKLAQGLLFTEAFYWDLDPATRAWSARFMARHGKAPTMQQAGVYSAVGHYLKAVRAAGSVEAGAVAAKMRALPIEDFMIHDGSIRADGRVIHDMNLLQAKTPAESHGEWDLLKLVRTIPAAEAFRPLEQGDCPLVGGTLGANAAK